MIPAASADEPAAPPAEAVPPRRAWLLAGGWFAASRLVILALGVIGANSFVDHRSLAPAGLEAVNPETVWRKWDVLWYERLAEHGYGYRLDDVQGQAAAAYLPLYPAVAGAAHRLVPGLSFFWVASLLSNLLGLAALVWLVRLAGGPRARTARLVLVAMTAAGSFYLSIPYAESLLLLLVVATIALTARGRHLTAAVLSGLAGATKVHGLAVAAVPFFAWLERSRGRPAASRLGTAAAIAVLSIAPLAAFMGYLSAVHGSAGAFVEQQAAWDNAAPYPFRALVGLAEFPTRVSGWLHGGFWFVYAALLARYWRRLPAGEAWFTAGVLVVSTMQESFHGVYRYAVFLTPLMTALAGDDDARVRAAVVGLNLVFGVVMILAFVTHTRLTV